MSVGIAQNYHYTANCDSSSKSNKIKILTMKMISSSYAVKNELKPYWLIEETVSSIKTLEEINVYKHRN